MINNNLLNWEYLQHELWNDVKGYLAVKKTKKRNKCFKEVGRNQPDLTYFPVFHFGSFQLYTYKELFPLFKDVILECELRKKSELKTF